MKKFWNFPSNDAQVRDEEVDGNTIASTSSYKKMSYYKTTKELLDLAGLTYQAWSDTPWREKLQYIEATGTYAADWVVAGLINFYSDTRKEGYWKAIKHHRDDYRKQRDFRQQLRDEVNRDYLREKTIADQAYWSGLPYDNLARRRGIDTARAYHRGADLHFNARKYDLFTPTKDIWGNLRGTRFSVPREEGGMGENYLRGSRRPRDEDVEVPEDAPPLQRPRINNPDMEIDNGGIARSRAVLGKFQGTRTKTQVFVRRRGSRKASRGKAIRNFFDGRMPLLTLRTYGNAPYAITSGSAVQGVYSEFSNNYCFPMKKWAMTLLNKMQKDMILPSGNTPGDGVVVNPATFTATELAGNMLRQGLSLLSQVRTYTFMNTVNSVGFLEVYEYVFKGNDDTYTSVSNSNTLSPKGLWEADMQDGDNPVWDTSVTFLADKNINIDEPGARPNKWSKSLNKFWRLEKKTKYIVPAGNTCSHTVNLPAMYLSADEITPGGNSGTSENQYDCIAGKTRCIMFIIHGQLCFEGDSGDTLGARIEYGAAAFNTRWRQITKARIQEHGQKKHIYYTGAHDFVNTAAEHVPLTRPTLLVVDPENATWVADRDRSGQTDGQEPTAGGS